MELIIKNPDNIELPGWIGESKLTLAEIGAVAVLACLQDFRESDALGERLDSPEMQAALASLKHKGVFNPTFSKDGDAVRITLGIDLDVVAPE